jgi:hypothetical protein
MTQRQPEHIFFFIAQYMGRLRIPFALSNRHLLAWQKCCVPLVTDVLVVAAGLSGRYMLLLSGV